MRYLVTSLLCVFTLSLTAQTIFDINEIASESIELGTPSLWDGTIAWSDNQSQGNIYFWDGTSTSIVASNCFYEISLNDGQIAYQRGNGPNNGVNIYLWDGISSYDISSEQGVSPSLYNGKIAWKR